MRTPLADLVRAVAGTCVGEPDDVVVRGLSLATQRIEPGDLYAALSGTRVHGASFAAQAVAAGAVAVLTDEAGAALLAGIGVPVVVVADPRRRLGALASLVYGDPAASLALMGVTGTQGKTTTTRLLEEGMTRAGLRAAVVGTVGTRIAGTEVKTSLTTPEAPDLHALFAVMREEDVAACAMEVSSHALVLGRVDGLVFDVAAFLNLGHDHLDFHTDVEDYFAAKADLFTPERARLGLTNVDDEFGRRLAVEAGIEMRTFSAQGAEADWRALGIEADTTGSRFTVVTPAGEEIAASVALTGEFNVSNALCAIALAAEAGFDPRVIAAGIASVAGVPGRLENVPTGRGFAVFVDYAHKPEAVQAALDALRPLTTGRLILVIGAGGDRDTAKRPMMGEIGARLADVLIVTDDNPRTEDPASIRRAVLERTAGRGATIEEIGDRRAAIRRAVDLARPGDTVLVAGKGHETGQEIHGEIHPFDDRDEVRAAVGAAG